MSFFAHVLSYWGYRKANDIKAPGWALATADRARWELPDSSMYANQGKLYAQLSWVQSAVRIIAEAAASTPLSVVKTVGEETEAVDNHPFEQLLVSPNPLQDQFDFIATIFSYLNIAGNAYIWLNAPSDSAPPTELWFIPPDKIQPVPDGKLYLKGYVYTEGGVQIPLSVDEICHFPRFHPNNRFVGLSPIEALAKAAVGDLRMQDYNLNFFGEDNAKVPGAMAFKSYVNDSEWQRIKDEWRDRHGGTQRKTAFLRGVGEGGVEWVNMGIPQKDMEFLAGRKFNREEIYELFGVPTSLFSELSGKASGGTGKAVFAEYCLWPQLVRVAQRFTSKVVKRYGDNLRAEFDDVRVSDEQMELEQRKTWSTYYTIDELRALDNLEPIGDERGDLLPVQIQQGQTGAPTPEQLKPFTGEEPPPEEAIDEDQPPDQQPPTPEADETMAEPKAYAPHLRLWRRKALRMMSSKGYAVCQFDSDAIPVEVRNALVAELVLAQDAEAVKALFDEAIEDAEASQLGLLDKDAALELARAVRLAAAGA